MFESQLNLSWTRRVAVFWAISWPAWIISFAAISLVPILDADKMKNHLVALSALAQVSFFAAQALLVHRLPRKKFRTFRIEVVRDNGESSRSFSAIEGAEVWFWIVWPQVVVITLLYLLVYWINTQGATDVSRTLSGLWLWIRTLLVGPYAVDLALRTKYPGFRLRAYGHRFI